MQDKHLISNLVKAEGSSKLHNYQKAGNSFSGYTAVLEALRISDFWATLDFSASSWELLTRLICGTNNKSLVILKA